MFTHRRYFNPVILNVVENFVVNLHFREKKRERKRDDSEFSLIFLEKIRKTASKKWT